MKTRAALCSLVLTLFAGCQTKEPLHSADTRSRDVESMERVSSMVIAELSKQRGMTPEDFRKKYNIRMDDRGTIWFFWIEPKSPYFGGEFIVEVDKITNRLHILPGI